MDSVPAIRPAAPVSPAAGPRSDAPMDRGGTAAQNGASHAPAAAAETERPVPQTSGAERAAIDLGDLALPERVEGRLAAAQRAYMTAVRAIGVNLFESRVP